MIDFEQIESKIQPIFKVIEQNAFLNQQKVLSAFRRHKVSARHLLPSSGYGYGDDSRDMLCKVFADCMGAESAIVSPLIASGTHAISLMLFGVLRPQNTLLSITGDLYDTLMPIISHEGIGSLADFGVRFESIALRDSDFDFESIKSRLTKGGIDAIFIQRSRGYTDRRTIDIASIKRAIEFVRQYTDCPVLVDNCYGEFVETLEPCDVCADLVAGSLIKNPGGGLAPTGGYIAGRADLVALAGGRLTVPGIGMEIGSYMHGYQSFFQGLFVASHTVLQALKSSVLFGEVFRTLGYKTSPEGVPFDIIRSIEFDTQDQLISFCQAIQACSPIDSHVVPEPWDMPGYESKVIMAAGAFVQGSSIELSADAPIKKPYIVFLQGGLTYEHAKIAVAECVQRLK